MSRFYSLDQDVVAAAYVDEAAMIAEAVELINGRSMYDKAIADLEGEGWYMSVSRDRDGSPRYGVVSRESGTVIYGINSAGEYRGGYGQKK